MPTPDDKGAVELLAILLLAAVLGITLGFRRITRGLELFNGGLVVFQILFLLVLTVAIVPWDVWWEGVRGFVTPARPPKGSTATELGSLAGFAAILSGFNWIILNHYRDKSYGMGYRVGFLTGLRGERSQVRSSGFTFPDDAKNTALWRRWKRLLYLDLWGVFVVGAFVGMLLPTALMRHLALSSGRTPDRATVTTFAADVLGSQYGRWLFYLTLLVGFLILFDTQVGIFEALVRNVTDAANISPRLQEATGGDLRRFYFAVHGVAARDHRGRAPLLPANGADPDIGQHVEPRCHHLSVRVHLPEQAAAQGGPSVEVGLRGADGERRVLRVLFPELPRGEADR